jgi:F-type H+-transporting ATPase subunit epsilon
MLGVKTFHLTITSVTGAQFDGMAESVTLPGSAGEMTMLSNHEPLVTTLKPGKITVRAGGENKTFDVDGGVLECSGSGRVTVLL